MSLPRVAVTADEGDIVATCECGEVVLRHPELVWELLEVAVRAHFTARHPETVA